MEALKVGSAPAASGVDGNEVTMTTAETTQENNAESTADEREPSDAASLSDSHSVAVSTCTWTVIQYMW